MAWRKREWIAFGAGFVVTATATYILQPPTTWFVAAAVFGGSFVVALAILMIWRPPATHESKGSTATFANCYVDKPDEPIQSYDKFPEPLKTVETRSGKDVPFD